MNHTEKPVRINEKGNRTLLDITAAEFEENLAMRSTNRKVLMKCIESALIDGQDYGIIPNGNNSGKPSLFKTGSEKVISLLGLRVEYPNLHEYETAALHGTPIDTIVLRCHLINQEDRVVGIGVGARSVSLQDEGDLNKAIKMSCKSAMVDATLRTAAISEIFTQDLEDIDVSTIDARPVEETPAITKHAGIMTTAQMRCIERLIMDPRLTISEREELQLALIRSVDKKEASTLLTKYIGNSRKVAGQWVKETPGLLDSR